MFALLFAAMLAVSCGGSDAVPPNDVSPEGTTPASDTTATTEPTRPAEVSATNPPAPALVDDAATDYAVPSAAPSAPTGALGFDRYVFGNADDGSVIPLVVEGPRGDQVRCQDPERACSYADLRALLDSGAEVPDDLGLTAGELAELVAQLDITAASVNAYPTPAEACAGGYSPVSGQNPNMGIHFVNAALLADGFDPANPEMLLFASEQGFGATRDELGVCSDDGTGWSGIDGLRVVGSAFFIDISEEHPEGFAGPLDLWHVHYNSCAGGRKDSIASEALCEQNGGNFFQFQPNWMMHTYVADGFDSQTGVFGMWNDSVWPRAPEAAVASPGTADRSATISSFTFENMTVSVGETLSITNTDEVPHTVVDGSASKPGTAFASELLGRGDAFNLSFDEPGVVALYCSLHPTMNGTVTVTP